MWAIYVKKDQITARHKLNLPYRIKIGKRMDITMDGRGFTATKLNR